jgi:hypothetical protein
MQSILDVSQEMIHCLNGTDYSAGFMEEVVDLISSTKQTQKEVSTKASKVHGKRWSKD